MKLFGKFVFKNIVLKYDYDKVINRVKYQFISPKKIKNSLSFSILLTCA